MIIHRALDGSHLALDAPGFDLSAPLTAFGFAYIEELAISQPVNRLSAGTSYRLEAELSKGFPGTSATLVAEVPFRGGLLRIAKVQRSMTTGVIRNLCYGAWESDEGCLTTSVVGGEVEDVLRLFKALRFDARDGTIVIDSPFDTSVRPLRCLKEVPSVALLEFRVRSPHITTRIGTQRGYPGRGGELYRRSASSDSLVLVTPSSVITVHSLGNASTYHRPIAESLQVEWRRSRMDRDWELA